MRKKNQRYMLDTNTVSYLLKGSKDIRERLHHEPMSNIHISVITEAELLYGIARRPEAKSLPKIVTEFLERVEILPWDRTVSKYYAKLRVSTEAKGKILGNLD